MPGFKTHLIPPPPIPLRSLVRDRSTRRIGVLIAWGKRAARVKFSVRTKGSEFVKLRYLEAVPQEEIDAILIKEAEDLV